MDNTNLADTLAQRKKDKPKIYREIADEAKAAAISADVAFERQNLATVSKQPRVDLNNLEDVQTRTDAFFASCEAASVLPTFLGLAVAFGYSRENLYKYLRNNSHTETAEYIELVRESLADIMITAALTRTTDNSTTIFALKNLHGFADKIELEPIQRPDPQGPLVPIEILEQKFAELPIDD